MFEKLESLMFDNVGKKLKNIIKWIMRVEIILLVIFAIIMEFGALIQLFNGASENFLFMLLIPIGLVLAIGVLWFSVVMMYGFAEIVDTAIINRQKPKSSSEKLSMLAQNKEEEENQKFWVCKCGMKNAEHAPSCKGCGSGRTSAGVRGDGGVYKKCACGAMVKQGEKCPLCDKMVY